MVSEKDAQRGEPEKESAENAGEKSSQRTREVTTKARDLRGREEPNREIGKPLSVKWSRAQMNTERATTMARVFQLGLLDRERGWNSQVLGIRKGYEMVANREECEGMTCSRDTGGNNG